MQPIRFFLTIILTVLIIYIALFMSYLIAPQNYHYRAWELFDNFIYNGVMQKSIILNESGDSSRDYIIQRYSKKNQISVNTFGNRKACYKGGEGTLMLGDSELFGAEVSDRETIPVKLCKTGNYNIYNGSRMHGLELLKVKGMTFSTIIFSASESLGIRAYCDNLPVFFRKTKSSTFDEFKKNYSVKISDDDIKIKQNVLSHIAMSNKFFYNYLSSRVTNFFDTSHSFYAPQESIVKYNFTFTKEHMNQDLQCATKLRSFFQNNNVKVGFFYFPVKQTIVDSNIKTDLYSLEYISAATKMMKSKGLITIDTKECLTEKKVSGDSIFMLHDTHLSNEGMERVTNCIINSPMRKILK